MRRTIEAADENGGGRIARRTVLLAMLLLSASPPVRLSAQQLVLPDSLIANARARVENGWAQSIVIGVVDPTGTRYYSFGTTAPNGTAVNERSVYEIGSITKVFTSLALADMAIRGELRLDDPVRSLVTGGATIPGGDSITLRLLAQHRSGLPRMPTNFAPADPANPYADYDQARLYAFLSSLTLTRAPGAQYEYSNLGAGFLGNVLAGKNGTSYEELIARRILRPLGLQSTMQTLTPDARARLAQGTADGRVVSSWDADALAGAGMLRSTAEDMTRFLAAAIGLVRTPLDSAFRLAATPAADAGSPVMRIGLGWHIRTRNNMEIVWHNGGTGGYRSWAGYDPARRAGVVVLTNSQEGPDNLGFHAFDHTVPLPPVAPRPIAIAAAELDAYAGVFQLSPTFAITVRREGEALFGQATNQGAFRMYPASRDEFVVRAVNARVSFARDETGRVIALVLHQNGRSTRGERAP